MTRWRAMSAVLAATASITLGLTVPHDAGATPSVRAATSSDELSATTRLADRRSYVIGTRAYEVGAEDGSYPASGFHTRGEMGGFWSMPIKLLDGLWFGANGSWLTAKKYTSGWGYSSMSMGVVDGVDIQRIDVAPDGQRGALVGLILSPRTKNTLTLTVDAHSELMSVYPWGQTAPSQLAANLPDTASYADGALTFRDRGTPPIPNSTAHDWSAVVASTLTPDDHATGTNFRGPQSGDIVCPPSDSTQTQPDRCDDTAYGNGAGGELSYKLTLPAQGRQVWFAVAGSDQSPGAAHRTAQQLLAAPDDLLAAKTAERQDLAARTVVDLPGDRLLQRSVQWSKQNIADARQTAKNLQLRVTHAGTVYPRPTATLASASWIGAGWPDYPWIFGTDGEYTAFAAVAAGQFDSIEDHLRTLMQISDAVNDRSGKVIHETTPDGSVYFGANGDDGNTDETVKFPSAVALVWRWTGDNAFRDQMYDFTVRNMHYVFNHLDTDGDGWLEGAGNVERTGMGDEKLDNTVYAIRGLLDLTEMAASKGDTATVRWARAKAADLQSRFESAWWYGGSTRSYADSLQDPGNQKLFQRYWIGLTPVEAELPASGRTPAGPLASAQHALTTVEQHERPCFTGTNGLFHTGTGKSSDARGTTPPSCDSVTSAAPADREIFTLTTSIAAVAEAALGRTNPYSDDNARVQLDPDVAEVPGAMPEISPSPLPDFGANIDKKFTERSSGLQAWGAYGVLWPVVHFELGVAPDLGRGVVSIVPQVPPGQTRVAGSNIRLGATGHVDVSAARQGGVLTTTVDRELDASITIGAVLPEGTHATAVTLDGVAVPYRVVPSARGNQIQVGMGQRAARATLKVLYTS